MLFNDDWCVIGAIDWEKTFAGPWELLADFPLTLSAVPPPMDAPWNYDEKGYPVKQAIVEKFADQREYINIIRRVEESQNLESRLSKALSDSRRQYVVSGMWLYVRGTAGWYSNLIDNFVSQSR